MSDVTARIDARTLKDWMHDGAEFALLDAREEVPFDGRHLLLASCVPLGRLEVLIDALVPRRTTRTVWCDDGEGLAARAADRMRGLGYADVAVLDGGVSAWEAAGYPVYSGVHVPSKAFAEVVEHEAGTPWITAEALKSLIDADADIAIFDTRTYEEFHGNSIPGAVSVPGAELVYRFADLTPSPDTVVVVNCGGRTRSIIGAQALINAGVPNKVVSLQNGTQAWHLSGYDVVEGATRRHADVSDTARGKALAAAARVKARFGIREIDAAGLARWRAEAGRRSLYVLDVRTPEEYAAGHLPEARSAPGGQLVQETDSFLGAWGGRVALVDDDGARATITASWLLQMGWPEVAVLRMDPSRGDLARGPFVPKVLGYDGSAVPAVDPAAAQAMLSDGAAQIVDLADSRTYRRGHIPGAWFAIRSRLPDDLAALPPCDTVILTSPDGVLAGLAAQDLGGGARALAGGTRGWTAAGLPLSPEDPRLASAADDIRLKAREATDGSVEDAMRAYLAWEIDLVNRMATDEDHRFQVRAD